MITPEELAIAEQAAQMSAKLLPTLRREQAELQERIVWLEGNLATWKRLKGAPEPTSEAAPPAPKERAKRGEAQARIAAIMAAHPEYGAREVQKAVEEKYSVHYGLSTIYRNIGGKSQEPAEAGS